MMVAAQNSEGSRAIQSCTREARHWRRVPVWSYQSLPTEQCGDGVSDLSAWIVERPNASRRPRQRKRWSRQFARDLRFDRSDPPVGKRLATIAPEERPGLRGAESDQAI